MHSVNEEQLKKTKYLCFVTGSENIFQFNNIYTLLRFFL